MMLHCCHRGHDEESRWSSVLGVLTVAVRTRQRDAEGGSAVLQQAESERGGLKLSAPAAVAWALAVSGHK